MFDPLHGPAEITKRLQAFPDVEFHVAENVDAIPAAVADAEILVTGNRFYLPDAAAPIREHGKSLRWLAFLTSGIDKAVNSGLPDNVIVTNAAGLRAFTVAEHAFALMLGLARRIGAMDANLAEGNWARGAATLPTNLADRHLVIVGVGAIGQAIARRAKAFDMRVTGVSRSTSPLPDFDTIVTREALIETARDADYLLVAALAGPQTQGMISREVIAALKPSARIINIARGSLIDEPAMIEALAAHRIAGAGLDVMAQEPLPAGHPLWSLDNVLMTPHIGGLGDPGATTPADLFLDNLKRWRASERLANIVIEPGSERAT